MKNYGFESLFKLILSEQKRKSPMQFFKWRSSRQESKRVNFLRHCELIKNFSQEEIIKIASIDRTILTYAKIEESTAKTLFEIDQLCYFCFPESFQKNFYHQMIDSHPITFKEMEQSVDLCLFALKKEPSLFYYVKIVPNPNFETTLQNLEKKKLILDLLK